MKFKRKEEKVSAVQWKGWPHEIKGIKRHSGYPQLAVFEGEEVYQGDWIVTINNKVSLWKDYEFKEIFERDPLKTRIDIIERFDIDGRGTVFSCKLPEIGKENAGELVGQEFDYAGDRWQIREVEAFHTAFGIPSKHQCFGLLVKRISA
jgi:hypothetical protein